VLGAFIVLIVVAFPKGIVGMIESFARRRASLNASLLSSRIETAE
jgi:branched-chain amino acid transport system permease protein